MGGVKKKIIADKELLFDVHCIAPRRKVWLYLVKSAVCIAIFQTSIAWILSTESRNWSFRLFPSKIFLKIGTFFRHNYSRFPSEACWSFSPCPTEACGSWLTSWYVPERKKRKEKQAITSTLSTVQTDSSMLRNHNAAHCSLFVYLNPAPRFPRLCHHLWLADRAWK